MTLTDKPFCAISTPAGTSGIAVIRASGEGVGALVDGIVRVIRSATGVKSIVEMPGYTACYAELFDPNTNETIDRVVLTHYVAPYSYTGLEMIEISCHGGSTVKQEILRVLYDIGMRPALPGEFTKSAFINGKLDLSEAEAVMDVIGADSERALRAANSQLNGKLSSRLTEVEDEIYRAMALIEMIVEFPEHDDTPDNDNEVRAIVDKALQEITSLKQSYGKGRILSERLNIALCGLPNSGKSSLLNVLAGYERAIVTNVPGTTRDTLEVQLDIEGIPVTLVDTAGMRDTSDAIEAKGVELAVKAFNDADMVLYLAATDSNPEEVITQINELITLDTSSKTTLVLSKSDLGVNKEQESIIKAAQAIGVSRNISISSLGQVNIEELKELILKFYENAGGMMNSDIIVTNRRHYDLLSEAETHLNMAIMAANDGIGIEVVSGVLRAALDKIGEITGKSVSANLADKIFAGFCIGK